MTETMKVITDALISQKSQISDLTKQLNSLSSSLPTMAAEEIREKIQALVQESFSTVPRPKDGRDGRDFNESLARLVSQQIMDKYKDEYDTQLDAVKAGLIATAKDSAVQPADVIDTLIEFVKKNASMFQGIEGKPGKPGKDAVNGKDGKDGKDAEPVDMKKLNKQITQMMKANSPDQPKTVADVTIKGEKLTIKFTNGTSKTLDLPKALAQTMAMAGGSVTTGIKYLSKLLDVSAPNPANGDVLQWDGSKWVSGALDTTPVWGDIEGNIADQIDLVDALVTKEDKVNKGVANGYAELDGSGTVPASQLPSYVDDVLEFANLGSFPAVGETGKIYIAIDTGNSYRWSGSQYVSIGAADALLSSNNLSDVADAATARTNLDVDSSAEVDAKVATKADSIDDLSDAIYDSGTNALALGSGAVTNGSNSVTIGNTAVAKTVLKGKVGVGTDNPTTGSVVIDMPAGLNQALDIRNTDSGNSRSMFSLTNNRGNAGFLITSSGYSSLPAWANRLIIFESSGVAGMTFFTKDISIGGNYTGGGVTVKNNNKVAIGHYDPDSRLDVDGAITQRPLSTDPADPDDGNSVQWVSNGVGSGSAGDVMMKINVGGTVKTITLVEFATA